jgi:prophage maintenance system killer protein
MAERDGRQVEWLEDLVERVRRFHDDALRTSGGVFGEHTSSLYAACARPFHSAFGQLIYKTPYERSGALLHAIVCDHAFVDGNKRTGTLAGIWLLVAHEVLTPKRPATPLQVRMLGQVALEAASEGLTVEQVIFWMRRIFEPQSDSSIG